MKDKYIELHYNVFNTIGEQLEQQNLLINSDKLEIYEQCKKDILFLYFHDILTDNMKRKLIEKLHKKIIKDIRRKTNE